MCEQEVNAKNIEADQSLINATAWTWDVTNPGSTSVAAVTLRAVNKLAHAEFAADSFGAAAAFAEIEGVFDDPEAKIVGYSTKTFEDLLKSNQAAGRALIDSQIQLLLYQAAQETTGH